MFLSLLTGESKCLWKVFLCSKVVLARWRTHNAAAAAGLQLHVCHIYILALSPATDRIGATDAPQKECSSGVIVSLSPCDSNGHQETRAQLFVVTPSEVDHLGMADGKSISHFRKFSI